MGSASIRTFSRVIPILMGVVFLAALVAPQGAQAQIRATVKAPQKISLGQQATLKIRVQGVPNAQLKSAQYQVEEAPFPYKTWSSTGPKRPVMRHNLKVQVKPRVNTKFRVVVESDGKTSRSGGVVIYVDGSLSTPLIFRPGGRVTVGINQKFDSSFGAKWPRIPRKDKFLYVFEACGNAARATTNYRLRTRLPIRIRTTGKTSTVSASRHLRTTCPQRFDTFWIVTYFSAFPNPLLKNGDDGFGKPTGNRKQLQRKQRLKLRRTLSPRQALSLLKGL